MSRLRFLSRTRLYLQIYRAAKEIWEQGLTLKRLNALYSVLHRWIDLTRVSMKNTPSPSGPPQPADPVKITSEKNYPLY